MPLQRSEDAARNLRSIWHGPTNAWRWPFDATYTEWGVGILTFLLASVVLWSAPLGVYLVLCAWGVARLFSTRIPKDTLAGWFRTEPARAPARARWVFVAAALLFIWALSNFPNPLTYLAPAPFWFALAGAPYVAVRVVRLTRPHIDGNRPVGYWISTLLGIARRPARPRREAVAIEFAAGPAMPDQTLDDAVLEFLTAVAAIDPKEVPVPTYRERTPAVEALLWDSRTGRAETCDNVVRVLQARGIPHEIPQVVRRERRTVADQYVSERVSVVLKVEDTRVPDDTVILLRAVEGGHRVDGFVPREEFGRRFEMVTPNPECPAHGAVSA